MYDAANHIYVANFKLKLCTFAQRMDLSTLSKFQFEESNTQSFKLKFSSEVRFLQCANFKWIFWRTSETLVKQQLALINQTHQFLAGHDTV